MPWFDSHPGNPPGESLPLPRYPWFGRVIVPAAIGLSLAFLLAYAARDTLLPARPVQVVPVVVRLGDAPADVIASEVVAQAAGWIEPDPYAIPIAALADGIVREVLVLEGERVKAGQVIATLVDEDAKLSLAKADADLADRQAQLDAARETWDHPIELQRAVDVAEAAVAQGEAEIARLGAELLAQQARLNELADQRRRVEEGAAAQSVSESERVSRRLQHEAQLALVKATGHQQEMLVAQLRQREAEYQAAKRNLKLRTEQRRQLAVAQAAWERAMVERAEAALRLERMTLRSPIDGVVLQRHVTPGSKLVLAMDGANSAIAAHLYDPARLQVRVDVPQGEAGKVGVGQPTEVSAAVLGDRVFRGEVTRVVHEADVARNTVQFKVRIFDPDPRLKPEMLARVKFFSILNSEKPEERGKPEGRASSSSIYAPRGLLQATGNTAEAWVLDRRRGVAVRRNVVIGASQDGDWVTVASGLAPGDELIVDARGLRDGQRVRRIEQAD